MLHKIDIKSVFMIGCIFLLLVACDATTVQKQVSKEATYTDPSYQNASSSTSTVSVSPSTIPEVNLSTNFTGNQTIIEITNQTSSILISKVAASATFYSNKYVVNRLDLTIESANVPLNPYFFESVRIRLFDAFSDGVYVFNSSIDCSDRTQIIFNRKEFYSISNGTAGSVVLCISPPKDLIPHQDLNISFLQNDSEILTQALIMPAVLNGPDIRVSVN